MGAGRALPRACTRAGHSVLCRLWRGTGGHWRGEEARPCRQGAVHAGPNRAPGIPLPPPGHAPAPQGVQISPDILKALGVQAFVPGNHDFDLGPTYLGEFFGKYSWFELVQCSTARAGQQARCRETSRPGGPGRCQPGSARDGMPPDIPAAAASKPAGLQAPLRHGPPCRPLPSLQAT